MGGTCGRAREAAARSPRCGTPAGAGPAGRLGRASPRGSPAWGRAAGSGPGLRQLGGHPGPPPAPPLTEEALHDPQRVTEPILPTGHLADGPEPARPGVPRRCSSSLARPLLARALPRRVSLAARAARPPRASENGGCGGGNEALPETGRWRVRAPNLHFAQWREIGAADRAACDLGGARAGRGGGSALRGPAAGRRGAPAGGRGAGRGGAGPRRQGGRHLRNGRKEGQAWPRDPEPGVAGRGRCFGGCHSAGSKGETPEVRFIHL